MNFLRKFVILNVVIGSVWAKGVEVSPVIKVADEKLSEMRSAQSNLYAQLEKAQKEENADIKKINCLMRKKGTVDGLVKASDRVRNNLLAAETKSDKDAVESYSKKINTYHEAVKEIRDSVKECTGVVEDLEGSAPTAFIQSDETEQ